MSAMQRTDDNEEDDALNDLTFGGGGAEDDEMDALNDDTFGGASMSADYNFDDSMAQMAQLAAEHEKQLLALKLKTASQQPSSSGMQHELSHTQFCQL